MNVAALVRVTAFTTIIAVGESASANAQTPVAPMGTPGQSTQPAQSGMMGGAIGRMGGMSQTDGMRGGMMGGGHMMKVMFAIADTNGDGALSFDEVTAVHKRIFDVIDANKDGRVTPEELQRFMQGQ